MSGLQGQTPYGLIVFGEGEMMFHGQGGFRTQCLWLNGDPTPRFHQNPSVLLEKQVVRSTVSLYLIMPGKYGLSKEDTGHDRILSTRI